MEVRNTPEGEESNHAPAENAPAGSAAKGGIYDSQSLVQVLARLPQRHGRRDTATPDRDPATPDHETSAAGPETPPSEESSSTPPEPVQPDPEPILQMPNDTVTPEIAPSPVPEILKAEMLSLTASQRTKRAKPGKIVLQPLSTPAAPEPTPVTGITPPTYQTVSLKKFARTGKTALAIEAPRPTTALPPVAKFVPKEEQQTKQLRPNLARTGVVTIRSLLPSPTVLAPPTPNAPATPPEPIDNAPEDAVLPPPLPDSPQRETFIPAEATKPFPREVIIAGAGLSVIILIAALAAVFVFLTRSASSSDPAAPVLAPATTPAPSNHAEAPPALQSEPQTGAQYSARGFARQGGGDFDGALADYDAALDLNPKDVQTYYRRAVLRQTKGNLSGAIADYNVVLGLDPHFADAYSNRGFVKQAQGDPDGALADYAQALSINPKIPNAYYNIGLIKVQKGNLDGAIEAYNRALELDPKMAIAYYNRGNAKNSEGNLDGAIGDYTQALQINPTIALAYCNRGFARQSKGDSDGAVADYTQAIALNAKMAVAYYNRGLIRVQKGDLDNAISDSSSSIDFDPKNVQAYCNRGLARLGKGDLDGAGADLRKFCASAPRDPGVDSARLYLWVIGARQNPRGSADGDLSTSLQNDWNSSPEDITSKIGSFLLGHIRENELIANASSPDPAREPGQFCKVWYFAGMKRLLAGDTATASADFQKCLATNQKDYCEYLFARTELAKLDPTREASAGH